MKVKEYRKQSADNPGQNLLRQIAKNAYFFLSSRQKLKPPPNECPISPLPLSKVV